jgi:autonomous glycyl radical cofactor GrcA
MRMISNTLRGVAVVTVVSLGLTRAPSAPRFQVDPLWPKPLPNHWILGSVTGVAVDRQDHVWIVHRGADSLNAKTEMGAATNPPTAEACCFPAPPVLEFDQAGTLVGHWGGPGQGYDWPRSPGGMVVDLKGTVWIAAAGWTESADARKREKVTKEDAHVLAFTRAGQLVRQIGRAGETDASDQKTMQRPAALDIDPTADEVYVADGYLNHRVIVFDAGTGAYKRHWEANGSSPFNVVSCVKVANDGLVYVCDRRNDRIQVFKKDGTFVKEMVVSKETLGEGSVWDVALSHDPKQRFLYVADGQDQKVFVLQRDTMEIVSSFGGGGRWPGRFYGVGSLAVDSKGNLYTGETFEGKRVQRFVFKGIS